MMFQSILFKNPEDITQLSLDTTPDFFSDLNLDQVIDSITENRDEYDLKPFFYSALSSIDSIYYRQDIFRDLETSEVLQSIKKFSEKMLIIRRYLKMIKDLYCKYHKEGWFLEAASLYCDCVSEFASDLSIFDLSSNGMSGFRKYIQQYSQSSQFLLLKDAVSRIKTKLETIKYNINIKGNTVKVSYYGEEIDYSQEVERTFEKFNQGEVKNYRIDKVTGSGMNHVEAQILDRVALLFPEIFSELDEFFESNAGFLDDTIRIFDREIQFFISYIDYIADIKSLGLTFCYPKILTHSKEIFAYDAFDIALASNKKYEKTPIVCNDFYLKNPERIIIISGPNQGGKTTFARMFGQLHFLACLGLPIPGSSAELFLFDRIFTHFEKEEAIRNLRGKLQDDLIRIHAILEQASSNSIIIMNEIFTSTTLKDAKFLSERIIRKINQLDSISVCVSFIDELTKLSEKTVSMVSTVMADEPSIRTFKLIRKPADGLSYAACIAEKYHLTYESIMERIRS